MKKVVGSLLCLLVAAPVAFSDPPPIYGAHIVRPTEPLTLFGQPLPGVIGQSLGAARVEIRTFSNTSQIKPLDENGASDETANPLLQVSHMGVGILSSAPTGKFNVVLDSNILTNHMFVRVYNTDDPSTATYYFDSEPFQLQLDNITLSRRVSFSSQKTIAPPDAPPMDSDGDGISDEDEYNGYYGFQTDPFNPDTDGDGINDDVEIVYGLDPTSRLEIVLSSTNAVSPASIDAGTLDWLVGWHASTNPYVSYTLDMVQDIFDFSTNRFPAALEAQRARSRDVTPTNTDWAENVTDWMKTNRTGFFRVRQDLLPLPELDDDPSGGDGN